MAQKGKEKAEDCLYTTIKVSVDFLSLSFASCATFRKTLTVITHFIFQVARDGDLGEQIGREIWFDLVDHDKVRAFRIQKQMPFTKFKVHLLFCCILFYHGF